MPRRAVKFNFTLDDGFLSIEWPPSLTEEAFSEIEVYVNLWMRQLKLHVVADPATERKEPERG